MIRRISAIALVIFFFLLNPGKSLAQDRCPNPAQQNANPCWFTKQPMPELRREMRAASDSNGNIYVIGGYNGQGGFYYNFDMYNPLTDSWTPKMNAPVARNDMGFTYDKFNGKFYAAGGYNEGYFSDLYEYDPTTDIWTQKSSFTYPRAFFQLVTGDNGKLYAIGGQDNSALGLTTAVEEYDPTTDTWITKTNLPTPRTGLGAVSAKNGKIYVIGGHNGNGVGMTNVEEYDPINNSWDTTKKPMPTGRSNFGLSLNSKGAIYAIDGFLSVGRTNAVEAYNPKTDVWTAKTGTPVAAGEVAAALGSDREIHVLGGWTDTSPATDTNYGGLDRRMSFDMFNDSDKESQDADLLPDTNLEPEE